MKLSVAALTVLCFELSFFKISFSLSFFSSAALNYSKFVVSTMTWRLPCFFLPIKTFDKYLTNILNQFKSQLK